MRVRVKPVMLVRIRTHHHTLLCTAAKPRCRWESQEFAPVAKDFQENKWVKFTPHYLVWVCPDSYHKSDECRSQCIRQGRYCTPDPDGDLAKGYSGADIVQVRPPE